MTKHFRRLSSGPPDARRFFNCWKYSTRPGLWQPNNTYTYHFEALDRAFAPGVRENGRSRIGQWENRAFPWTHPWPLPGGEL